jgi:cysteine-rich repeat protein
LAYSCSGGSLTNKDTCKVTCGDNTRDSNEECDDGNTRNGDGCSSLCLIETGFGCSTVTMQDDSLRDECYACISNCAICTDTDILSCSLCYVGYYKSDTACTNSCDDGYYPDSVA